MMENKYAKMLAQISPHRTCCLFSLIIFVLGCSIEIASSEMILDQRPFENATLTGPKFTPPTNTSSKRSRQDEFDILPPKYYRDVAPMLDGKPVKVQVSVIVLNIKLSQGSSQTFDADIFYHNYWSDYRLQKPTNEEAIAQKINLDNEETLPQYKLSDSWRKRLWVPDTHFRNAIGGNIASILTPTYYFTITNYTEVFMAVRLSLKLSCEMNFSKFPFDTQKCFINITTTSEDLNTVVMEWDTFRVGSHVDVTEFQVVHVHKMSCVKSHDIGIFPCLYGEIHFKRNTGNYLIKRFIPSLIIVCMTFIGFWIPTQVTPARTSLQITALLALITQQIQSDLNVSYIYALQVWNLVCIMFVFANLLEYAVALSVMHMSQKRRKRKQDRIAKKHDNDSHRIQLSLDKDAETDVGVLKRIKNDFSERFRTTSRHSSIDYIARYLFPLSFTLFVICFAIYVS